MKSCNHCCLIIISRFLSFLPTKKQLRSNSPKFIASLTKLPKNWWTELFMGIYRFDHTWDFFSHSKQFSENWYDEDFYFLEKPILIVLINLFKVLEFPKGSLPITPTMLMNRIQSNASFDWDFSDEEHYPTIKASPNR